MRQYTWLDVVVKDYDCEILYHPGKANVIINALSCKTASSSVKSLHMRISIDLPLLGMIREDLDKRVKKENWKQERLRGEIGRSSTNNRGLLTLYGCVWVPDFCKVKQVMMEEAHKSKFLIHPIATTIYWDLRLSYW